MAELVAPRKTRPRSPTLDAAHEVIRPLGLRDGEGDPPQGDAGRDSDLEAVPEPSTGSAPAEPAPPAGSVPTLCPVWKRGHCTGEGWCPKQHPQPGPDDGALPEVGPAAACAALRYGMAQGWILDETARGRVNIEEAVDRVTNAGQAAVALQTGPATAGPQSGSLWNAREWCWSWRRTWSEGCSTHPVCGGRALVDHPGVHRPTGVALLHVGGAGSWTGAILSHTREWLTNPGARYPPVPVLEQLTAPTPGVRHTLHRASALTEQLNDEVLDLALEPLRVLYPQTHIPPAGTSNRLGPLGLQHRVEAAHPGGVVEQWLTLRNPVAAEGHWYLHQLLCLPRAAPEHRRQNPYHTHPERRGAQGFPQPVPPALLPGQGPEALQQGPPLDTATTVQQRERDGADGAEPDVTNCGAVAWMAACRHLARDTTGLRRYRPTDRTVLASAVAAVTMGPVAAWPAQLLPHVPCRDTQPRRPAATHAPTAPLTAEQLYIVAAALLADGGESFVHHHGPAQIAGSIQGPQRDAPDPWHATLRGRTRVWDAGDGTPPPGPKQGEALVLQTAGYQTILHGHAGEYRSHVLVGDRWTVWHSTARQGGFPPLPHVDWQQGPTQAYYMSVDPWPLAVLLHTVSAPNKRHEPAWFNPPALVWSPDQEEHLRAAWQGDAIRATDVLDLHAGPITHARPAATLAVAQRGQQNPQWVVCMFSPADAHIVVCDPERLPGPEAVIRVADCTRMIVKHYGRANPTPLRSRSG